MKLKVFMHGQDNMGWSIDADRVYAEAFLREIGCELTRNVLLADVVHSVWWNELMGRRNTLLRMKRRIIATATNFILPDNPQFRILKKRVSIWIAPSKAQMKVLEDAGVRAEYQPFYVDESVFRRSPLERREIAASLGLDAEGMSGKFLLGSFQRDTLGADLVSPKWQKGPELLVEILDKLPGKERWLLVIAGPRRHYVLSECKKRGIPYVFVGKEPAAGEDDAQRNKLDADTMSKLYSMIDCYLVTSKSEGGPKAVLEASFCKTLVLSTKVGFAPDMLGPDCLYGSAEDAVKRILALMTGGRESLAGAAAENQYRVLSICSRSKAAERWQSIYAKLLGTRK